MKFNETNEFKKDYKKLSKKFRTLKKDLDTFIKLLKINPRGNSRHFVSLTETDVCVVIKARLFCQSLKGKSLRIVYAYNKSSEEFDLIQIDFIEVFFKGDKAREDKKRIINYIDSK